MTSKPDMPGAEHRWGAAGGAAHLAPKRAQEYAAVGDWPGYFSVMDGKPPRETLLAALAAFDAEGHAPGIAIDLGSGEGRDTLELLRRGWRVIAVDSTPQAFEYLQRKIPSDDRSRLTTCASRLEELEFPKPRSVDFVNASFTLPFVDPGAFSRVWRSIVEVLRPGGRFAGQFFGDRDDWASVPGRSHQPRAEVEGMLADFQREMLTEDEKQESPEQSGAKHWHVYHVVAKKNPLPLGNRQREQSWL